MVPFIAVQMQALKIGESITLVFTTVVDELSRGLVDEDEDVEALPTDRAYWENQATKETVGLADELLAIVKQFDPSLELKYNKMYIGLSREGQPFNFVTFRPKKHQINLELKLPATDDFDERIEDAGIETLEYSKRWGLYRLRLTSADVRQKTETLRDFMQLAYERRIAM